jgi:probable HAF family extracellular repeat protein
MLVVAGERLEAANYRITDLGTLGGSVSFAFDVNVHGDVVGSSTTVTGETDAFLYHNGAMTDLGVLDPMKNFSQAFGINDSSSVVGSSLTIDTNGDYIRSRPFVYSDGTMSLVGTFGGDYGWANDISNADQIVGISADSNGVTHAFRATGGTMLDLGTFSEAHDYSIGYGIKDARSVAGYSTLGPNFSNAFLYRAGDLLDLGNLGGFSRGFAVNDADHVAGTSIIDDSGQECAFLWREGTLTDLGTTAEAITSQGLDINNLGQVVGTLVFEPGTQHNHGFLYSKGTMIDVNTLLPEGSEWLVRDAQAINDLGQIVGFGNIGGQEHAYLLTPVPEPSSCVLALGAEAGFLGLVRGRQPIQRWTS